MSPARRTLGNTHDGVVIIDTADTGVVEANTGNNTVGGTTATARNVISGNHEDGVAIVGATEVGNVVLGNYIGTNIDGQRGSGVDMGKHLGDGMVDHFAVGPRRLYRVQQPDRRDHGRGTKRDFGQPPGRCFDRREQRAGRKPWCREITSARTQAARRPLETNATACGSILAIDFTDSALPRNNTIGGSVAGAGNLISAYGEIGVAILGASTGGTGNVVQGNFIGSWTSAARKDLGNLGNGVRIDLSASENSIGGPSVGADAPSPSTVATGCWLDQAPETASWAIPSSRTSSWGLTWATTARR